MKRFLVAVLALCVLTSIGIVLVPAVLIRPFIPQTFSDLETAYFLRSHNRWLTLILALGGVSAIFLLWPRVQGGLRRSLLVLSGLLLIGFAVLARQNHFEWMFHPLAQEGYANIKAADHVGDGDMVLAVEIGGDAKAFPVPMMAYHHLVNTQVGGEPIVATY